MIKATPLVWLAKKPKYIIFAITIEIGRAHV